MYLSPSASISRSIPIAFGAQYGAISLNYNFASWAIDKHADVISEIGFVRIGTGEVGTSISTASVGLLPEDGFTGYFYYGGNGTAHGRITQQRQSILMEIFGLRMSTLEVLVERS
jgi:hypothetical protein